MSALTFTTMEVGEQNQFEYWNDLVCEAFIGLQCSNNNDSNLYKGSINLIDLESIEMSMVECEPSEVYRQKHHISNCSSEVFMLHLQINGISIQRQNNQECILYPGDLAICQSSQPYSLSFNEPIKMMVIKVPYAVAQNHITQPELLAGLKITGKKGIATLLINHLLELWNLRDQLDNTVYRAATGDTVSSLLSMTVKQAYPNLFSVSNTAAPSRETQILRLRNYICNNLSDPALSPKTIAEANGISRRYMRRIFNQDGITCQQQILSQRIDMIAKELEKSRNHSINISELAFKWGFNNLSHFSRTFKQIKGVSAKDYRIKSNRS